MKTQIDISDFTFTPSGYGHYKVTYTSPATGKKRNIRQLKAILRKMCIENNIDQDNVSINENHGYVQTVDFSKKDADFCRTEYNGKVYVCRYLSGCFNPFILEEENKQTFVL